MLAVAGCFHGGREHAAGRPRLVDGSLPGAPPRELAALGGGAVRVRTRVLGADESRARIRACARTFDVDVAPGAVLVERIGVAGRSLTFRAERAPWVYACDATAGPRERPGPWCGGAVGRLYGGRLRDPRLDIACRRRDRGVVGFAWVHPARGARWVALEEPTYTELYEVVGELPVRVATGSGARIRGSRATFELRQYAADGSEVARTTLTAVVAG